MDIENKTTPEHEEMKQDCRDLRTELKRGYKSLEVLKNSGQLTDADLDYELARDRKAALIFKSIIVEIGVDKYSSRKIAHNKTIEIEQK